MNAIEISVILVNYNTAHLLEKALGDLRRSMQGLSAEIVVIDNASRDDSVERMRREHPDCELIVNQTNVGFGRANNQALPIIKGRYVLLLNTDAFVEEDTLAKTLAYMEAHPRCGILGVRLVGRDGVLQPSARYFPTPWSLFLKRSGFNRFFPKVRLIDDMGWDHASVRQCDWVPGCYYLVRREVIDQVGLFDPRYFLYFEEVDHCFATKKAGWDVTYFPDTTVVHIGGESAKSDGEITSSGRQLEALQLESELLYFRKNHGFAGLVANVFFLAVSDLLTALRRLLRGRTPSASLSHLGLLWKTALHTRLGRVATR